MSRLAYSLNRQGTLRLVPLALRLGLLGLGACQLVVSPSGPPHADSDEAGVSARECGDRTCGDGTVCCNASCGICTAPGNVCIQIACEPEDEGASCSTVLCGPRDRCMETPAGAVCVPIEEDPCNLVDCQPESTCKVEKGAPICVPVGGKGDAGAPTPKKDAGASGPAVDAGSATDAGSSGQLDAGADAGSAHDAGSSQLDAGDAGSERDASAHDAGKKDSGVIVNPPITCATVLCAAGTYCDDISGSPQCIPLPSCATVKCSAGYHCELEQVVCVRAPCPPQPRCVPDADPGDPCGGKCKANQICQVLPIACITTPCPAPVPQCVPRNPCGCTGKGACLDSAGVSALIAPCPVLDEI